MANAWALLLLIGSIALGAAGCVLAPVPVPGPVVVAPRPAYGGYYGHYRHPYHHRHRHW